MTSHSEWSDAKPGDSILNPMLVLIVEDDPAFRYFCARALSSTETPSFRAVEAETAKEALEILKHEKIDGVLLDYNLPDATGIDFMDKLRNIAGYEHNAVVIMTSGGSESLAAEAMRVGAADYITKQAISHQSLSRALGNAIERANLQRAIRERAVAVEKANRELIKRNDEISRFYHTVSHETKTPLTAALLFLSMLKQEVSGPLNADQMELVEQATLCCEELVSHFDDLIDSTRLETGKLHLEKSLDNLPRVVQRAVAGVQPIADEKQVVLRIEVSEDIPDFIMDGSRIVQVLANLLGNAVKFTHPGGEVRLCAELANSAENDALLPAGFTQTLKISVTDSGIGIAEQDVESVFDRLYQVGEKGDPIAGAGLGLGLPIAKEIVALHQGRICVKSEIGVGSTFTIQLPIKEDSGKTGEGEYEKSATG